MAGDGPLVFTDPVSHEQEIMMGIIIRGNILKSIKRCCIVNVLKQIHPKEARRV
jgi:hypothetical protein